MTEQDFFKILEEMPTGLTRKIKIGENEYGLRWVKEDNPNATMHDIHEHNIEMEGWADGFKAAVEKYKEWRNEQYLKLKNLK